jgi:ATP-binding cassette subfamily B protein
MAADSPAGFAFLASRWAKASEQLRYLPRAWRLVRDAAGPYTAAWLALLLVQGLLPVAVVYLTRDVIDGLTAAMKSAHAAANWRALDWSALAPALVPALLMAGVLLLTELLHSAAGWIRSAQARLVEDHVAALVHRQSTAVDLGFYESPDFHDHLHRARAEATFRPVALLENCGALIQNGITLTAMAAVLVPYGAWMSIALILSTLPALVVVLRYAIRQHHWWKETTADERRSHYFDWLMTAPQPAAELRLFDLGPGFHGAYQEIRARLRQGFLALAWRRGVAELCAGVVALVAAGLCLGAMMLRALSGQATLGEVALFYQAFSQGQRLMRSLLDSIGQLYYNVLFLGNLFQFLDLRSTLTSPSIGGASSPTGRTAALAVRFRDVTFRYPGSTRIALSRLDLTIPAGQIAAVVGANGAGKSTLLKLLCRYYDPESGTIELGGVDLREYDLRALRRMISVLFQDPVHYNASVAENIALSEHRERARDDIVAAARGAGADALIDRLPEGYETLLGKWFAGGVELSIGEWQRLALARAFLRHAPLIVLDEPTSAMDSWAEAEWMQRFRALAAHRTAILITHRFTTAMQADVIHVMDGGAIVESGSHDALVALDGLYAQSWAQQMRAGREKDERIAA